MAELRSNVDRMEQCFTEFGDMMQTCVDFMVDYRIWWLQKLQTDKEELALAIETAIQEVTHSGPGVEPGSALGRAMWTFPTEELQVFKYTVSVPDLPTLCQNWASYDRDLKKLCQLAEESARPISVAPVQSEEAKMPPLANRVEALQPTVQPQLALVTDSCIKFFDFQKGVWKQQLPHHIQANGNSRWVLLEDGSVFVCGGGLLSGVWSTAYVVGVCAEEVQSMQVGRSAHGVLAYNNQVYVFGGFNLNSCEISEKYHLQLHTWTLLPSMQEARSHFNPCLFNHPQTDLMLPFHLSVHVSSYCCIYVEDNLLVVHLYKHILKYRTGQAEQLVQASTSSTQEEVWAASGKYSPQTILNRV